MDVGTLGEISMHRLQVFVAVVETGGYSTAAAQLDMAQPSVSYQVRALERALGADLVVSRHRDIHLTPEGEVALRAARTILNEGYRLGDTIGHHAQDLFGREHVVAGRIFESLDDAERRAARQRAKNRVTRGRVGRHRGVRSHAGHLERQAPAGGTVQQPVRRRERLRVESEARLRLRPECPTLTGPTTCHGSQHASGY